MAYSSLVAKNKQPTYPASVNRANSLTKDILFASTPAHGVYDGVSSQIKYNKHDSFGLDRTHSGGLAWRINRYESSRTNPNLFLPGLTRNHTLACVFSFEDTDYPVNTGKTNYYLTGPTWGDNSSTAIVSNDAGYVVVSNGDAPGGIVTSSVITPFRTVCVAVFTSSLTEGSKLYLNGVLVGSNPSTYNPQRGLNGIHRLAYSGDAGPPSAMRPWAIYMSAGWARTLTAQEVATLSDDPYQLFQNTSTAKTVFNLGMPGVLVESAVQDFITASYKRQRTTQPETFVLADYNNPLNRDLVHLSSTNTSSDSARLQTKYGVSGNKQLVSGSVGRGLSGLASNSIWESASTESLNAISDFSQHTLLTVFEINKNSGTLNGGGVAWGDNNSFQLSIDVSSINISVYSNSGNPSYLSVSSAGLLQPGKVHVVMCTAITGGDTVIYVDGKEVARTATPPSGFQSYNVGYQRNFRRVRYTQGNSWISYLGAGWKRALSPQEILKISQNPWQLFEPQLQRFAAPKSAYTPQPLIGGKYNRPTTNNLKDYPQVATNNSIARDLYNIMVMGRRAGYSLTSISANNYQRSDHTPGNPASWPTLRRVFDSKYGIGNNVPTSSTDDIRDINVFNTFQKTKGATLLAVTKFQSTTSIVGVWDFLRTGAGYTLGLGMQFQSTGTELQLRSAGYRAGGFGMQYSPWATVPADTILVIVLTSEPNVGEKLYVNGKLLAQQTSVTLGLDDYFNGSTKIGLGHPGVYNSTNSPKTAHYFAATWGRPLTELEVREISDNPLQLIKPSTRTFYTTMPSGVIVPRNRFLFFFN
jgi:hypothetical protein